LGMGAFRLKFIYYYYSYSLLHHSVRLLHASFLVASSLLSFSL
jgi:hypothetical protein